MDQTFFGKLHDHWGAFKGWLDGVVTSALPLIITGLLLMLVASGYLLARDIVVTPAPTGQIQRVIIDMLCVAVVLALTAYTILLYGMAIAREAQWRGGFAALEDHSRVSDAFDRHLQERLEQQRQAQATLARYRETWVVTERGLQSGAFDNIRAAPLETALDPSASKKPKVPGTPT